MDDSNTVTFHSSDEPGRGDFVEIGYEPLDSQKAVGLVTHPTAGAISMFVGTTRDNFQGKKVVRLEYEGYTLMAASELRKICVAIREKWPEVVGVALFHRLGIVKVTETSVVVAVSSPHRQEALEACAFAIDTLKATVPIWKNEQYEGDERMWKENVEWKDGAASRFSCCGKASDLVTVVHSRTYHIMEVVVGIEPRRLALRYEPPGIIVEYMYQNATSRQLYHHEINLKSELETSLLSNDQIEELVRGIIDQHAGIVGNGKIQEAQLLRLVKKLLGYHHRAGASLLPQADYNCVSETLLNQVKLKMDLVYEQNIVRPNQENYIYDKKVEFLPATELSDWDD